MSTQDIEVFVEVVDAEGFSRAAQRLGMPTTTVSSKIARLEARLGVTLIQRTTRRLHITAAGRSYYGHCVRALSEMAEAQRELADAAGEPTGLLHITTPADFAQSVLPPIIERFLRTYPRASVELTVTNRMVDLVAEGIDLAVRIGPLEDSSLTTRRFHTSRAGLWAAPGYLRRRGVPKTPADLARHDLLRFSRLPDTVTLRVGGDEALIDFRGRLATDDLDNLRTFILRGAGIGLLPDFLGEQLAKTSAVTRVLPDYVSPARTIYFVFPAQKFVPQTVRAFIGLATDEEASGAERRAIDLDADRLAEGAPADEDKYA
jgi:DNA-binding transcriptional LysR family regulator